MSAVSQSQEEFARIVAYLGDPEWRLERRVVLLTSVAVVAAALALDKCRDRRVEGGVAKRERFTGGANEERGRRCTRGLGPRLAHHRRVRFNGDDGADGRWEVLEALAGTGAKVEDTAVGSTK